MTGLEKQAYIAIRRKTACSRAELARKLEISRPTASSITGNLLKQNRIIECGKGKSTGGTSPTLICANPDYARCIGIDFGYTDKMSAVLLDAAGDILSRQEALFRPQDARSMISCASQLIRELSGKEKISGVAIALSAIINENTRQPLKSVNPLFCDRTFQQALTEELGGNVFIANRSRAAAISEAFGGAADGEQDFALISLGKSVGAAFWCGGALFCGSNSAAGEIRNLRLSGGERLEEALSRESVSRSARSEILKKCADALSQIIDIMDFKLFVLSGRFADFGEDFACQLEQELSTYQVRVKPARFGRFSAARGSAFQMVEEDIRKK